MKRADIDRRRVLAGALGFAALSACGVGAGSRAAAATGGLAVQPLAPGVALVSGAGSNVVTLDSPDGVVMIDGGLAAHTGELLRLVQSGRRSVRTLFNTHWHWDHTGSNLELGKAGVRIIAHENTRLWMQRPVTVPWEHRTYPAVPAKALPNSTFYVDGHLQAGAHTLHYGALGQAHTDGDLYVHLQEANILVVGDVVSVGSYPVLDWTTGGWIGGMLDANKLLLKLCDEKTQIVPGTGPVVGRAALQAQSDMLEVLKDRIWQLMRKGQSDTDIVAAQPTKEYDAQWGDPTQFLLSAYKGLWGHVREQRGVV